MKNLDMLVFEAKGILDNLNIDYHITTYFRSSARMTRNWGYCRKNEDGSFTITIAESLLYDEFDDTAAMETIIHELLHTCENCFSHKGEWKRLAKLVSDNTCYNISRTSNHDDISLALIEKGKYKYIYRCTRCGSIVKRSKKCDFTEHTMFFSCARKINNRRCHGKFIKIEEV